MSRALKLKGATARNFFAQMMVDNHGEEALKKCSEGGPMWESVKAEIEYRKTLSNSNKE